MTKRSIRVGVVQLATIPGDIAGNLGRAEPLVAQAAAGGADLVALPELFSAGYVPNRDLWPSAERAGGPTIRWLSELAHRFEIHVGGGYAARDSGDVTNVYSIAAPDGSIAGTARKWNAEAYVFRRGHGIHVIRTALGRIGVGICADCQSIRTLRALERESVEVVLMPHASPTPAVAGGAVKEADVGAARERMAELPGTFARTLGVPAVYINQVGEMAPMTGLLGRLMDPATFRMQGGSRAVDADGNLIAALGDREGVLLVDVELDASRRRWAAPRTYGGWLTPGSVILRRLVIPLDIALGRLSYRRAKRAADRAESAPA